MHKKCLTCSILLDIPCVTLGCPGHHNERVGEVCASCAAHEREARKRSFETVECVTCKP